MLLLPMMSVAAICVQRDTLFLEDFGGNSVSDPKIATTHNPQINNSYTMVASEANLKCDYENKFAKTYLLTKVGKHSSGWHLQMDHTYPNDSARGYFMLVDDGPVADAPIYTSKGILVSPYQKLHFGASFANVRMWYNSNGNTSLTIPAFRIRLLDMVSGNLLKEFRTDPIPYDSLHPDQDDYIYQAPWLEFEDVYVVPSYIDEVQVEVAAEETSNRWGNDYAVDDIILYEEHEVMTLSCAHTDTVFFEDFGGNNVSDPAFGTTPVSGIDDKYTFITVPTSDNLSNASCYLLPKSGVTHNGNWYRQDDHTYPNDTTRGYFLTVDGCYGIGEHPIYRKTITGVHKGDSCLLSAYLCELDTWYYVNLVVTGIFAPSQVRFCVLDSKGNTIVDKLSDLLFPDTNLPLQSDWQYSSKWLRFEEVFLVPDDSESLELIIYNINVHYNGAGNDFALDDIMLLQCANSEVTIDSIGCDSVAYNGEIFYKDTVLTYIVDKQVYQVNITVNHSTLEQENHSGLDSLEYDGTMYYADTTLIYRGTTKDGCEAVRYVTLQIAHTPVYYLDNLIVNEMNWLIVCNNRLLREKYPAEDYSFQWIKNGQPVQNTYSYSDYYTEDERLEGQFELEVTVHNNGQPNIKVHSNIITILPEQTEAKRIAIYDKAGVLVYEAVGDVEIPHLLSGFYVVRTEQDNTLDIQKLIVR